MKGEGRGSGVKLILSYPGSSVLAWEIGDPVSGNRNNQARQELGSFLWVLLFVLLHENINEYLFLIKIVLGFSKHVRKFRRFLQKMVPYSLSFFPVTVTRETSGRKGLLWLTVLVIAHHGREVTVAETPGHIATCQEAGKDRHIHTVHGSHLLTVKMLTTTVCSHCHVTPGAQIHTPSRIPA